VSWPWFSRALPIVLALLAACQPVPQPFLSADPVRDHPLSLPVGQAGVLVRPVAGAPDPAGLAKAMAAALQRLDVAAGTQSANRDSLWLSARVDAAPDPDSAHYLNLRLHWLVRDLRGGLRGDHIATAHVTARAWRSFDPDLVARLVRESAAAVAPLLSDNARIKTDPPPPLVVHEVLGAPGDGAESLRRALADALRRRGYTVTDTVTARAIVLSAVVRLTPRGKAGDDIDIAWTALAPDGATLGTVRQANRVPSGSLSGAWGRSAAQAATAAVPGIIDLLGRARHRVPKT
jgi:hypothetical protein